jgi:thioredoxin reductase
MAPGSSYDVIIVGYGAAGAAAAIDAADAGARVLVLDRGYGGAASKQPVRRRGVRRSEGALCWIFVTPKTGER